MTIYETVEYNSAKDLLIVRNSKLEDKTGNSLLSQGGWIEIPLSEVADILPSTPGPPKEFHWLTMRRDSAASEGSGQGTEERVQGDGSGSDSAHPAAHKRVYKRAPVVTALHAA